MVTFAVDISGGPSKKWPIWSLDKKNAIVQEGGFDHEVFLRATCGWDSTDEHRVWRLRATAFGLSDAPVAFRRPPKKNLVNSAESSPGAGLKFEAPRFDPRRYFIFRISGRAVGAITTHNDDSLGCGETDLLLKVRFFWGSGLGS